MASGREDYYFPDVELTAMLAKMDDNITALGVISTNLGDVNTALALVATKLSTGADMIDALDALDGTVDGLLTLGELNSSQLHDDLVLTIAELVDAVAELTAHSGQFTDITYQGWYKITTSELLILDMSATASSWFTMTVRTHPANTDTIRFTYFEGGTQEHQFTLAGGGVKTIIINPPSDEWNKVYVKATSGEQYYQIEGY